MDEIDKMDERRAEDPKVALWRTRYNAAMSDLGRALAMLDRLGVPLDKFEDGRQS